DSPLYLATREGHIGTMKVLLSKGVADVPRPFHTLAVPLITASRWGCREGVQLLLDHGANINDVENNPDALVEASLRGHEKVVQLLLDHGADVNAKGGEVFGNNALQIAAGRGDYEIVKLLLEKGADVD
ncbi:ankyrin, partial [Parathielavia hyrcaniae]